MKDVDLERDWKPRRIARKPEAMFDGTDQGIVIDLAVDAVGNEPARVFGIGLAGLGNFLSPSMSRTPAEWPGRLGKYRNRLDVE